MGEIATWSAVKQKVGLGKDGNDCPTKAELLALSPIGTGENYLGLELSNPNSYGNNECVQLSDIHKVTYKYTYIAEYNTLSFAALGGTPISQNQYLNITSTKQKYLDGVAQGSAIAVGQTRTYLDWITYDSSTNNEWIAAENLELTPRSGIITWTQKESGKKLQTTLNQAAATQSWVYGWSVNPQSLFFGAHGGTQIFTVTSHKQEIRNYHNYGNQIPLTYTRVNTGVTGSGNSVTMGENNTTNTKSGSVVLTQAETNKKLTISCSQSAGYKTYSEITFSELAYSDIPASGASDVTIHKLSYSQTWGWNGNTTNGGTLTSGAQIIKPNISQVPSLGTTAKPRTLLGRHSTTIRMNGKEAIKQADLYQAENFVITTTYGTPVITQYTHTPSGSVPNTGGDVTILDKVNIPTTQKWASGSTSPGPDEITNAVVSIDPSPGFTLISNSPGNRVVRATANTGTNQRSCTIHFTYPGAESKSLILIQTPASISYDYFFGFNEEGTETSSTLSIPTAGGTVEKPYYSYYLKKVNGVSTGEKFHVPYSTANLNGPSTTYSILERPSDFGGVIRFTEVENIGGNKSWDLEIFQGTSNKTLNLHVTQAGANITWDYVFNVVN